MSHGTWNKIDNMTFQSKVTFMIVTRNESRQGKSGQYDIIIQSNSHDCNNK